MKTYKLIPITPDWYWTLFEAINVSGFKPRKDYKVDGWTIITSNERLVQMAMDTFGDNIIEMDCYDETENQIRTTERIESRSPILSANVQG